MPTSAWLPTETKREKPRPASAARIPTSSARLPLWEISPIRPAGRSSEARSSCSPASNTPMQFGPSSSTPAARARSASARSRAPPASPSAKPAVMITTPRAPASIASSTVASSAAGGTATTTSSGGSGRSASERCAGRPSTVSARRLTRNTRRRPLPRIAPRAIQWPHLAWSSDAPTTATEAGANSTERSRRAGASVTRRPPPGAAARPCPRRRRRRRPRSSCP